MGNVTNNTSSKSREKEFLTLIDAKVPYSDRAEVEELVRTGIAISPNAVFAFIYEVVCPPRSQLQFAKLDDREYALSCVRQKFEHPLKDLVLSVAERSVRGEHISDKEISAGMKTIADYPKQHEALDVLLTSADDSETAEQEFNRIIKLWYPDGP